MDTKQLPFCLCRRGGVTSHMGDFNQLYSKVELVESLLVIVCVKLDLVPLAEKDILKHHS